MTKSDVAVQRTQPAEDTAGVRCRVPAADVYETADAYVLMLNLPGVEKEAITLTLNKGELRVRAASFARSFGIGEGIDTTSIDAHHDKGVLTVKLYKHEILKPREISIN